MRPIYLSGDAIYLRPMLEDDKAHTVAWYASPLPLNSVFGEAHLKDVHQNLWDPAKRQFAIVRSEDDEVIGGAVVEFSTRDRKSWFELHMIPLLDGADGLQADAIRVLVPWLLTDHNMRRVDVTLAATDSESVAAAEQLGMFAGVRLREFWRRPHGRVDAIIYQILNPNEEHLYA